MIEITQKQVAELVNNASVFTDGGEWAVINAGSGFISIDGVSTGSGNVFIVEQYKTPHEVFGPEDAPSRENLVFVKAHQFEDGNEAIRFYGDLVTQSALQRLLNGF